MNMNLSSANKRTLMIIEDNELNRDILSEILSDKYKIIVAENGKIGLELLAMHYREISLILLDVYMPVCNGFEFLEVVGKDALLSNIPIIVTTGSSIREDEVQCLKLGASDFVRKPYNTEIVRSRIKNIINLKESVATLSAVEFDGISGVYTMPAFYHHAGNVLRMQENNRFEIGVFEVQEFNIYNSIFGERIGNELLRFMGNLIRSTYPDAVIGRQWAKFFVLKSQESVSSIEETITSFRKMSDGSSLPNIRIKYGVCKNVGQAEDISVYCERAFLAVLSIKDDSNHIVAEYNEKIQQRLISDQSLEMGFDDALKKERFVIWYQPKIDTITEKIVGAEALVRWINEEGTLIPPGIFIPLFEKRGIIDSLDRYVFQKVCLFQKKRLDEGKELVPISVNLSRNSIYNKETAQRYHEIITEIGIAPEYVAIELTESTAIDDAFIQKRITMMKECGFSIHLDDFGTGYSSLSSLIKLPLDVIKLDKSLIDQIGTKEGENVLECLVMLSKKMKLHVVAEGVETKEQADWLKEIGCEQIQGYFYSRPVSQADFERKIENNEKGKCDENNR